MTAHQVLRHFIVSFTVLLWGICVATAPASAQTMNYSVYTDLWSASDQPTIYGYSELDDVSGCAAGGTSPHTWLYSPTRYSEVFGSTTTLPFNRETGDWTVVGNYQMQCNCAPFGGSHSFTAGGSLSWHLAFKNTFYKNQVGAVPFCRWTETNCQPGTFPTCTSGVSLKVDFGCQNYAWAEWLVAQRGTSVRCLIAATVGLNTPEPGYCD